MLPLTMTLAFLPPAVTAKAPMDDLDAFISASIDPRSDPEVLTAIARLCKDAASFRVLLNEFSREQPNSKLIFKSTTDKTFGSIDFQTMNKGYLFVISVQSKLTRLHLDSLEPWVGSMIYCLHEMSRQDLLLPMAENNFVFNKMLQARMWNYQRELRKELRVANSQPKLKLATDGQAYFKRFILEEP